MFRIALITLAGMESFDFWWLDGKYIMPSKSRPLLSFITASGFSNPSEQVFGLGNRHTLST
jgi:hypothetical protein